MCSFRIGNVQIPLKKKKKKKKPVKDHRQRTRITVIVTRELCTLLWVSLYFKGNNFITYNTVIRYETVQRYFPIYSTRCIYNSKPLRWKLLISETRPKTTPTSRFERGGGGNFQAPPPPRFTLHHEGGKKIESETSRIRTSNGAKKRN